MKKISLILVFLFLYSHVYCQAQADTSSIGDTLLQVTVHAFNTNKKWLASTAPTTIITASQMHAIGTGNLLNSLNTVSGVRMEERSPGSYRVSIRGSLLRSPFGVRNIKVYWNDIPFTDAGGNTYFNLIDAGPLHSIEIIKGPASSMYGANTGGVMLLNTATPFTSKKENKGELQIGIGSYGLLQANGLWKHSSNKFSSQLLQTHQQSDGYRMQSALKKDNITWNNAFAIGKHHLNIIAFYTRLFYQTPGGLTLNQMMQNPKAARLASNGLPGATEQNASVTNATFFMGMQYETKLSSYVNASIAATVSNTDFKNPFITNYEERNENNVGVNSKLVVHTKMGKGELQWINGAEWLYNKSTIANFGNRGGLKDTIQYKDAIATTQCFGFSQVEWSSTRWSVFAGISVNKQVYRYNRTEGIAIITPGSSINEGIMPRINILYKAFKRIHFYGVVSKGFSPPSLAEFRASDGNFNTTLKSENGWNKEVGIKSSLYNNQLVFDVSFYSFGLRDAIVRRNNSDGNEFFVNAGGTSQQGVEFWSRINIFKRPQKFVKQIVVSSQYAYQNYQFKQYMQGNIDYTGNKITGIPSNIIGINLNTMWQHSISLNIMYQKVSKIPLTDYNDVFAKEYHLLQAKASKEWSLKKISIHLYMGIDNILNENYSLGNDINAAGKRFYNPAATINFYSGCIIKR